MDFANMSKARIQHLKEKYPKGTRIELDYMDESDPRPIPPGTKGTVLTVDDIGTIHCRFDNGRLLGICTEVDRFHRINDTESSPNENQEPQISL